MAVIPTQVQKAAERLRVAGATRRACPPVRDLIGTDDVASAYQVQQHVTALQQISGAQVVGRKVGLTSKAVQLQLKVDQPNFGTLLDTMAVAHDGAVPTSRLLQPKIEAELGVVLGEDLDGHDISVDEARGAVSQVCAALEIVDSRIQDWNISIADTVADNASSGFFVLSDEPRNLGDRDLRSMRMELLRCGEVMATGSGANCLGDPLLALAWLASATSRLGMPLRAGEVILTGALGPMVPVAEGDVFEAVVGDLPPARVRITASTEFAAASLGDRPVSPKC